MEQAFLLLARPVCLDFLVSNSFCGSLLQPSSLCFSNVLFYQIRLYFLTDLLGNKYNIHLAFCGRIHKKCLIVITFEENKGGENCNFKHSGI